MSLVLTLKPFSFFVNFSGCSSFVGVGGGKVAPSADSLGFVSVGATIIQ
jgi:hypothetical protein